MLRKLFKEPLSLFLLLAAALFVLFQQVADDVPSNAEIIVTDKQIQVLVAAYKKIWQRIPNAKELDNLIESYIREEVLYREAVAMGLDRDDGIVRRRLKQKMEFISEDIANVDNPPE